MVGVGPLWGCQLGGWVAGPAVLLGATVLHCVCPGTLPAPCFSGLPMPRCTGSPLRDASNTCPRCRCRRDEILRHICPGALKLVLYEGQPQPGAGGRSLQAAGCTAMAVLRMRMLGWAEWMAAGPAAPA